MSAGTVRIVGSALRQRMKSKALLSLTDRAAQRLQTLARQHNEPVAGFRLGVKERGCNGLAYTLDFATEKSAHEDEVADKGVKVFVSPQAVMSVIGTEMDFVDDKLRSEFIFTNPNATATCGCGESFTVDRDELGRLEKSEFERKLDEARARKRESDQQ